MTVDELNEVIEASFEEIRRLRATKGRDYAHSDDHFDNFKRHAQTLGLSPEQIWAVYASKHWDAVMSFCARGKVESEPIEGRIDDLLVYLLLLKGQVLDGRRAAV